MILVIQTCTVNIFIKAKHLKRTPKKIKHRMRILFIRDHLNKFETSYNINSNFRYHCRSRNQFDHAPRTLLQEFHTFHTTCMPDPWRVQMAFDFALINVQKLWNIFRNYKLNQESIINLLHPAPSREKKPHSAHPTSVKYSLKNDWYVLLGWFENISSSFLPLVISSKRNAKKRFT